MWIHPSLPPGPTVPPHSQASRVEGQLIFLSKRYFRTWKSTQPFLTSYKWLKVGTTKVTTMAPMGTDPYGQLESSVMSNQLKPSLGFLLWLLCHTYSCSQT